MSHENVELVRRYLWAFEHDDALFDEITHPQIEWGPFEDNHTVHRGLDGARGIKAGWFDAWVEHHMEIEELIDGGDDVVASLRVTARGRASGVEVDVRLYPHMKVRDGRVSYVFEHGD